MAKTPQHLEEGQVPVLFLASYLMYRFDDT